MPWRFNGFQLDLLFDCFFPSFPLIGDSLLIARGVQCDIEGFVAQFNLHIFFCHGH